MPQAGSMLTNIRKIFGDTAAAFIDDTAGLTWLDQGQQDFTNDVWVLEDVADFGISKYVQQYFMPSDCILPMSVMWMQTKYIKLEPEPPNVWDQLVESYPLATGNAYHYTVIRRANGLQELRIGPQRPSKDSATALASGVIATTATTLGLNSASGIFRTRGWVIVGSGATQEVVEYTGVATSTLTGCLRGQHNTVASNIGSNTQITQVDLQVRYKRIPAALATNTSPEIPVAWHRYLETYAMYLAKLAHGEPKEAEGYLQVYLKQKETARKSAGRRHQDGLQRIKPRRLGSLYPPV